MLDALAIDLRRIIRSLGRERGFAFLAIGIAGLGIGAATTVFGLWQALILRPLPFQKPEQLVWIANGTSENLSAQTVQVSNLRSLLDESRSFNGIAGFSPFYGPGDVHLTGVGEPARLTAVPVTQTFFPLLGVKPLFGRFFDDAESRFGAARTVVLSFEFFKRRFGGDRNVVGRSIVLDDSAATVIGVLPPTFDFAETFTPGRDADVFVPFPLSPETDRQGNTLALIGRLNPGARLETAQTEATAIAKRMPSGAIGGMWRNKLVPRIVPLRARVSGRFEPTLFALAGAVGFLMLIVCANLSNLLLVRASVRRRELAIRAALGASPRHLIARMLAESFALCAGGALAGLAFAATATRLVSHLEGTTIPLLGDVRVDFTVFVFAVLLTAVTAVAFGILPALQVVRLAQPLALADEGRTSTTRRGGALRRAVVVAEIAVVCVLLTGAGLLTRSLRRVLDVSPGFATENVVALRVDQSRGARSPSERRAYLDELVRAVHAVPGVASVGLTDALPLGDNFGWRRWSARASDQPNDELHRLEPLVRMVDAGYFATMRIPVREGRGFTDADVPGSEPVVIINDRLAAKLWPGQDAVGRRMQVGGSERRVVGVVSAARYFALDREAEPEMYMPLGHPGGFNTVDLVMRGSTAPATVIGGVRAAIRRVDASLPVANFRTMAQLVDRSIFARRFLVVVVAGFAAFGLLLSALGIYAVLSYSVSQRTREIGIRMALGATQSSVRAGIFAETGRLAAAGVVIGMPLSWMVTRTIKGFLYDVPAFDPLTFCAVFAVLSVAAAVAVYRPVRRATDVDPVIALRG